MDQHLLKLLAIAVGAVIFVSAFSLNLGHLQALDRLLEATERQEAPGAYHQTVAGGEEAGSVSGATVLAALGHRLRAGDAQRQNGEVLLAAASQQAGFRVDGAEITAWEQLAAIAVQGRYSAAYTFSPQGEVLWVDYSEIR